MIPDTSFQDQRTAECDTKTEADQLRANLPENFDPNKLKETSRSNDRIGLRGQHGRQRTGTIGHFNHLVAEHLQQFSHHGSGVGVVFYIDQLALPGGVLIGVMGCGSLRINGNGRKPD